jgi:OFA family oxalate/formate antiporter-like MFS transporter
MNKNQISNNAAARWFRLVGAALILMVLGVLYAWSIFRQPLSEMFPDWTPVDMSWAFTISMIGFLAGGVVSGRLTLKVSHRVVVLLGAVLLFIGFFGASRIDAADPRGSLIMLYIFYGICCGLGIGMPYNAILGALLKWFPGKEGLASGVMLMGFGLGGLILGSAIGKLVASYGLNTTFIILAILVAAVAGGGSSIIRAPQSRAAAEAAEKERAAAGQERAEGDYTPMQMARTAIFLLLVLWMVSDVTAGLMVMNSAATIAIFYGSAAGIGLIATVFNGAGRIFSGALFDRFGGRLAMVLCGSAIFLSGITMLLGALNGSLPLIIMGLPLAGLGYGGAPVITSAFVSRNFGPRNYTANISIANLTMIVPSVAGPLLSGKLQEMEAGGFTGTFVAMASLGLVAVVLAMFVRQRR